MQDTTFITFWIIILSLNMNNRELGTTACTVKVKCVVYIMTKSLQVLLNNTIFL